MCKAVELTEELIGVYRKMHSTLQKYQDKLSNCDKEQSDILHMIENGKFNACEGYLYAKKLQDIRHKRRMIKNEYQPLLRMTQWLNVHNNIGSSTKIKNKIINLSSQLNEATSNKGYTPRVLKNYNIKNELKHK